MTTEECIALLRRAAKGRRLHAHSSIYHPEQAEYIKRLQDSAAGFEAAADLLEDPDRIMDIIPFWMWTDEERASFEANKATMMGKIKR